MSAERDKILLQLSKSSVLNFGKQIRVLGEDETKIIVETQSASGKYVVKYDKDSIELRHEAVVGLYALNYLRSVIPNFPQVIGYYRNIESPLGIVGEAVLYEYVEGVSLYEYLKSAKSTEELKHVLLQLILALYIANKTYKSTHYDLHARNIIINKLPVPREMDYQILRLKTKIIPYVIDYGRMYINLAGMDCGIDISQSSGLAKEVVNVENQEFWPHDVFHILTSMYSELTFKGNTVKLDANISKNEDLLEELRANLEETEDKAERKDILGEIKEVETVIDNYKRNLLDKKNDWIDRSVSEFVKILEKLILYLVPNKKFDFSQLYLAYGKYFHLTRTSKNAKLQFSDFVDYALGIIKSPDIHFASDKCK